MVGVEEREAPYDEHMENKRNRGFPFAALSVGETGDEPGGKEERGEEKGMGGVEV